MPTMQRGSIVAIVFISTLVIGCSSSRKSMEEQPTGSGDGPASATSPQTLSGWNDTLELTMQNERRPEYESRAASPAQQIGSGAYAVQIGAYKLPDNAERIAVLARERFGREVRTVFDRTSDLYKVMVGSFTSKDDARKFRDEMAQKYPTDYRDAWVSEVAER